MGLLIKLCSLGIYAILAALELLLITTRCVLPPRCDMQNTALIYLLLLLALLVAFPLAVTALLARLAGPKRRPEPPHVSVADQKPTKVRADAN